MSVWCLCGVFGVCVWCLCVVSVWMVVCLSVIFEKYFGFLVEIVYLELVPERFSPTFNFSRVKNSKTFFHRWLNHPLGPLTLNLQCFHVCCTLAGPHSKFKNYFENRFFINVQCIYVG